MAKYSDQLVLSAQRSAWQIHERLNPQSDPGYLKLVTKIIHRDRFQCQFCGFSAVPHDNAPVGHPAALGYLTVAHLDGNHHQHEPSRLVTACPFCEQTLHAGNANADEHGIIIHLPEITQAELNLLMHAIGIAITREDAYHDSALRIYFFLRSTMTRAMALFGHGIDDPVNTGQALMRLESDLYPEREKAINGLRFLPDIDSYETEMSYWSTTSWKSLPAEVWEQFA